MANVEPPKRCYEITIKVGADTWEDLTAELSRVPEMTHEKYFELLQPFLSKNKRGES